MEEYDQIDDDMLEARRQLQEADGESDSSIDDGVIAALPGRKTTTQVGKKPYSKISKMRRGVRRFEQQAAVVDPQNEFEIGLELEDVRELEDHNAKLMVLLDEKEEELSKMRQLHGAAGGSEGFASGLAENRIIELSKKNRSQLVALEKERTHRKRLEREVADLHRALQQSAQDAAQRAPSASVAQGPQTSKSSKGSHEWEAKCMAANHKASEYRVQVETLKAELARMQKTLQRELGDDVPLTQALNDSTGWKGRAEQISLLKARLRDQKRTAPPSRAMNLHDSAPLSASRSRNRSKETAELSEQLERCKAEAEASKKLHAARSARIKTLERDLQNMRAKIRILLEKGENDDQLIETLKRGLVAKVQDPTSPSNPKADKDFEKLSQLCTQQTVELEKLQVELDNLKEEKKRSRKQGTKGVKFASDSPADDKQQMEDVIAMLQQNLAQAEERIDELEGEKGSSTLLHAKAEQERTNQYLWQQLEDLKRKYTALLQEVQQGGEEDT